MRCHLVRPARPSSRSKQSLIGAKKSSPAAYSYLPAAALDDLQHDYATVLHDVLSHASLRPPNLGIIPGRKAWLLTLDLMVLSDAGNVYDALFMAARAALWDTHVPKTRAVEYRRDNGGRRTMKDGGDMDVDPESQSGLDTRSKASATDFELEDSWDEGPVLGGRDAWPVCVTLNLVPFSFPLLSFLAIKLIDTISTVVSGITLFGRHNTGGGRRTHSSAPDILLLRQIAGRASWDALARRGGDRPRADRVVSQGARATRKRRSLVIAPHLHHPQEGEKYALEIYTALNAKLKDEELRRTDKARLKFSFSSVR